MTTPSIFHRILVPTDFSESSDRAFSLAVLLARAGSATLHVLHDLEIPAETITAATIIREQLREAKAEARRKMEALIASHGAGDVVAEQAFEQSMNPVRSIPYYAEEHGIDLIVMGAHGHHSLKEKLVGSRAERVLRDAACPVITVAPREGAPVERVTHIVVPIDFSEEAAISLRLARGVARLFDARLSLLHATGTDHDETVQAKLRDFYERETGARDDVEAYVSHEKPGRAVTQVAEEIGADLIVMSTHSRKGIQRMMEGNVVDRVVPHAPCPVLTIPAKVIAANQSA